VRRALDYLTHHAIAITALGCSLLALAGASYAAFGLARHSITPDEQNPSLFGGYVRAWASVTAGSGIASESGRVSVRMHEAPVPPGDFDVFWRTRPDSPCVAIVNVDARGVPPTGAPTPGYAIAESTRRAGHAETSTVLTYNAQGQAQALPFDVALLCATPR
jgi:hypothetical protein